MPGGQDAVTSGAGSERAVAALARIYLHSTGKAVAYEDLRGWLALFFGLPDDAGASGVAGAGDAR